MALFNFQVGQTQAQQLQAKALEEQEAARGRQAAGLKSALSPFGAETAGELGGMLTSGIASQEQLATATLADLQARRSNLPAAPASPMQQAELANVQAQTQQRLATAAKTRLEMADLPIQNQLAIEAQMRDQQAARIDNRRDYQATIQGNEAISAGINGVRRLAQLESTLNDPNASALDIANAAVLVSQIVEPGLAVRGDDRVAVEKGASSGLAKLGNDLNQMLSGNVDVQAVAPQIMRTAMNLARPMAVGTQDALNYWKQVAVDTPGVGARDAFSILGIDEATAAALDELTIPMAGQGDGT